MNILLSYRNVYQIVKSLDEHKTKCSTVSSLFSDDLSNLRRKLVILTESILLDDFESIGRKTRDILWRKVYYDPISTSKRIWKKSENDLNENDALLLYNFIRDGIKHYKTLILKFEDIFNLDIRYIIDFSIIANGASAFEKKSEKEIYTTNETNHAMETIHNFLVCLGDLNRYCIEFKFAEKDIINNTSKQLAAKYYYEAFKLNPKIGMPHNQLGTLASGENYEMDSIFHYLYSLCSSTSVELSEANVSRIFHQNNEALEKSEATCDGFNVRDFIMQVILLVDIFFYDKEIVDFNAICCSVLMNFKEYLIKSRRNSQADITFQMTSIFMLCLFKLNMKNSSKVQSLNAFLVAFCAKILEIVNDKIDDFITEYKVENSEFCDVYNKKFHDFDRKIKRARETYRGKIPTHATEGLKDSGIEKNGSSNSQKDGSGSNHLSEESKTTFSEASGKSQPGQVKIAKRPSIVQNQTGHNRRRRKRRGNTASSSDEESESESILSDDGESMNSDFDSYDEDEDYLEMRFSSDDDRQEDSDEEEEEEIQNESDGEDIVIENEEIVYKNADEHSGNAIKLDSLSFHDESNGNDDDIVIEEETIVFREEQPDEEIMKLLKMKYKKKYTKIDPNLVLKFNEKYTSWMQSLKLLFDWLRMNNEIILGCYRSNPEFITQIMKLVNFLNIDTFTRKIYFDRSMITFKNLRENLRYIFDTRLNLATSEDIIFKKFALFEELQQPIDWNLNYKLQITPEEDILVRVFKMIDFGFHLCKTKKFNYSFCARSRVFIEKQRRRGERSRNDRRKRGGGDDGTGKRVRRRRRNRRRDRKFQTSECERISIKTHSQNSQENEEFPSLEQSNKVKCKGYLRNKAEYKDKEKADSKISETDKNEMMGKLGKLWLKNEVQTLESRSKPVNTNLTPYLMLDTKSLTDYLHIVKNLVKTKKFVVLIPKAGKLFAYKFVFNIFK